MTGVSRGFRRVCCVALSCMVAGGALVGSAIVADVVTASPAAASVPTGPFNVDVNNREDVRQFYNLVHDGTNGITDGWNGGNIAGCVPGSVSPDYLAATLARINYFRTMAGMPDVTFNGTDAGTSADPNNAEAQAAALMQAANGHLSHKWTAADNCFSQLPLGVTGSGASNLDQTNGNVDANAIDALMYDGGALGHRRNTLDPTIAVMGAGAVPSQGGGPAFMAQLVLTPNVARPATRTPYIAWPPAGFVPYQVVYPRWSFGLPGGDFSAATVTVMHNGSVLPTTIQCFNPDPTTTDSNCDASVTSPGTPQYGDPAISWKLNVADGANWPKPTADDPYTVTIGNVVVNGGAPQSFTYTVTVIDPAKGDAAHAPSGTASPPVGQNSTYTVPAIPNATGYQWRTTPLTQSTFNDGAENGLGNWTADVSGYAPIESGIEATGNNAFHLSLRDFAHTETLTLNRTLLPNANSQISFDSRAIAFDHLIARLEVSANGGTTWDSPPVYEQDGGDEAAFTHRTFSLGAYAGQQIMVRFSLDYAEDFGGVCECDSSSFYFDNVALSNVQEVGTAVLSAVLPSPSFSFNPPAAGVYAVDVRPQYAGPVLGLFSLPTQVTAVAATSAVPILGMVDASGGAWVKQGSLTSSWTKVASGASAIAVATDPVHGPLIGVITASGFYAKQGSLTGSFTHEAGAGVSAISVATDATNGPLLGMVDASGFWAKQGSVTGSFTHVAGAGVTAISVATDATHGPLLGLINANGFWAKQGSLTGTWIHETGVGATAISAATDPTNGPVLGLITSAGAWAKQAIGGSFVHVAGAGATAISVGTDATHGPLVAIINATGFWAKQGSLTGAWTHESGAGANAISVASDATNGPLLGLIDGGGFWAKQGAVTGSFNHETAAVPNAIAVAG